MRSELVKRGLAVARAATCAGRAFLDPKRTDMLVELYGHVLSALPEPRRRSLLDEFSARASTHLRELLATGRRLKRVDVSTLAKLPAGSLGASLLAYLERTGIDPNDLPAGEVHDELSLLRAHVRESHDLWHVMLGFDVDVAGEMGVQGFCLAQMPHHMAPLIVGGGMLHAGIFRWTERNLRMRAVVRGWLLGSGADSFLGIPWDELWEVPLADVRRRYRVDIDGVDKLLCAL